MFHLPFNKLAIVFLPKLYGTGLSKEWLHIFLINTPYGLLFLFPHSFASPFHSLRDLRPWLLQTCMSGQDSRIRTSETSVLIIWKCVRWKHGVFLALEKLLQGRSIPMGQGFLVREGREQEGLEWKIARPGWTRHHPDPIILWSICRIISKSQLKCVPLSL